MVCSNRQWFHAEFAADINHFSRSDSSKMQVDRHADCAGRSSFHGIVLPLVTPLLDRDVIDRAGLERLIEYVLAGGVHGLFLLGTTGEASALSSTLRREFV